MKTKIFTRTSLAVSLGFAAFGAQAIEWSYFGSYNPSSGAPLNMITFEEVNRHTEITLDDLYKMVLRKLPEGKDIRKNNTDLITDDMGANLYFVEDAEVSVTFLHEGAGYLNSVGFFTFKANSPPKTAAELYNSATASKFNHKIMFPNFSVTGNGGSLKAGNTIKLGSFKAGTAMGFSILANAWKSGVVNPNQSSEETFYTIKGLNPEPADSRNLNAHTVLLAKPDDQLLTLGFEDINRTYGSSDHDFNDVVMVINVTPFTALDRTHVNVFDEDLDSDDDGVPDSLDAFPDDPERASRRFYPSATGNGYLAFEDNWPSKGDYDMNDWVVGYRVTEILNAQGKITDVQLNYDVVARGAAFPNGFAVHLPGVPADAVKLVDNSGKPATTIAIGGATATALQPEEGQKEAVFVLVEDTLDITNTGQSGTCYFYNTSNECPATASVRISANISFKTPLKSAGSAPYNPFLFRKGQRGLEIHLVDHPPTDKADPSLFGTADDASNPKAGKYYRSAKNLPWALDIPDGWQHPKEYSAISDAYQLFGIWAESAGTSAPDWYSKSMNQNHIYKP